MIKLGNKVKDKVTGFTGIATAYVKYLNGCEQFCVKPTIQSSDKMPDGHYIDIGQLEYVDEGVVVEQNGTGGPQMDTPRG